MLISTACSKKNQPTATTTYYNYTPSAGEVITPGGVELQFLSPKYAEGEVSLQIAVFNNTEDTLSLDPLHWNFIGRGDNHTQPGYFYDPVQRLEELENEVKIRKNSWWLSPIAAAAKLSFGIASQAAFGEVIEDAGHGNIMEGATDMVTSPVKAGKELKKKNNAKVDVAFWKRALFMPVDIPPGKRKRGIVFFYSDPKASYYDLYLKVGNESVTYQLHQK